MLPDLAAPVAADVIVQNQIHTAEIVRRRKIIQTADITVIKIISHIPRTPVQSIGMKTSRQIAAAPVRGHVGLAVAVVNIGNIAIPLVAVAFNIIQRILYYIKLRRPAVREHPEIGPRAPRSGHFNPRLRIAVLKAELAVAGRNRPRRKRMPRIRLGLGCNRQTPVADGHVFIPIVGIALIIPCPGMLADPFGAIQRSPFKFIIKNQFPAVARPVGRSGLQHHPRGN